MHKSLTYVGRNCYTSLKSVKEVLMSLREKAQQMQAMRNIAPFESKDGFEAAQRMGKLLTMSNVISGDWRGNIANAVVAIDLSQKTGIPAMTIANHIYVVHGNVGFSAEFYRAIIHGSGRFVSLISYEFKDNDEACRAYLTDTQGEVKYGSWYSVSIAKAEGLYSKKGSKWKVMPEVMLKARAATLFAKDYVSDIYLGLTNIASSVVKDAGIIDVGVVE